MKKLLFTLFVCMMSINSFAQKYYEYCEVYEIISNVTKIAFNDGKEPLTIDNEEKFVKKFGEYVTFKNNVGFINYLSLKGWEVFGITYNGHTTVYSLRKEVSKEELEQTVEQSKK